MKSELDGGSAAEGNVERRLARHFAAELHRAERDYPSLRVRQGDAAQGPRRTGGAWPRLAIPVAAVGVLVAVGLVGLGLAYRPGTVSTGPTTPPVVRNADGIPNQIDGQRVYRITDKAEWQDLSGSFLLGAYAVSYTPPCPPRSPALPASDTGLVGTCMDQSFAAIGLMSSAGDPNTQPPLVPAPRGADALAGWLGGPAVVMRVHTHDAEAAQCSAGARAACEAAVVVEAVVWPEVPTEIAGERVYRAADKASFASIKGSFLLGGRFSKPDFLPPCPAPIGKDDAAQLLINCVTQSIDGLQIAPMSIIDEPKNEIVVARVHVNDEHAAWCSADVRASCEAAIVVESVVWRSDEWLASSPSAGASASVPVLNPSAERGSTGGPVPSTSAGIVLGADGVPTTIGGETVYRASNLPSDSTFLLGGPLGRDSGCAAPTGMGVNPPACGYWTIDGVAVGDMVALPESMIGGPIVVEITRWGAQGTCASGPCRGTSDTLVVTAIVWIGPPAPPSPNL